MEPSAHPRTPQGIEKSTPSFLGLPFPVEHPSRCTWARAAVVVAAFNGGGEGGAKGEKDEMKRRKRKDRGPARERHRGGGSRHAAPHTLAYKQPKPGQGLRKRRIHTSWNLSLGQAGRGGGGEGFEERREKEVLRGRTHPPILAHTHLPIRHTHTPFPPLPPHRRVRMERKHNTGLGTHTHTHRNRKRRSPSE